MSAALIYLAAAITLILVAAYISTKGGDNNRKDM